MNFADLLRNESKWVLTENGADALKTTGTALLDMYAQMAAMRNSSAADLTRMFDAAFEENPLGALRCLFYMRDVRGGQGERRIFRILLHALAKRHPDHVRVNLPLIPVYGRWDDLYALIGTPVEADAFALMRAQLEQDLADMQENKPVSLMAKWLKKANSSHRDTKLLGVYTAKKLGMSVYEYKRACAALRRHLDVVEIKMSAGEWEKIDYEAVPSRAMMIYRRAFASHDESRFRQYLSAVEKGEAKIHSDTLYPYDIVEKILYKGEQSPVLEAQWKALPDYVDGEADFLVMADVSGSMSGRPMASSIALGMYFAERCHGAYHNLFMTFSSSPTIVELRGKTLFERVRFMKDAAWGWNTDFEAAMRLVLDVAVKNHCKQEELPKALVCVTDMQFDRASCTDRKTYTEHVRAMFAKHGYTPPVLIFWNVNARKDTLHARSGDEDVILVSGQSAATFENLIRQLGGGARMTPEQFMLETINAERYQAICLPE